MKRSSSILLLKWFGQTRAQISRLKNHLIGAMVLVLLAVIGASMNSHPAAGQGNERAKPVTVVNTPLPVQGTVGVNNFPSNQAVSVTNTPTVSLAAGSSVNVTNPLDAQSNPTPLATLDASQPYEDQCELTFNGSNGGACKFQAVPAGKRLVIQEVDITVQVDQGLRPTNIEVFTPSVAHQFTATFMGTTTFPSVDHFSMHQETHLYVGKKQTPACQVFVTGVPSLIGQYGCALSGFLVDVP